MGKPLACLLVLIGCAAPSEPSVVNSVLFVNTSQMGYEGEVFSGPVGSFVAIQFHVEPGQRACLTFQESQLRGDSIMVVASYFINDATHIFGDTLTPRPGHWTWDGFTASPSAAC